MANACVGLGFVINPDGSLGLNGPRSVAWPYGTGTGCAIGTNNGAKVDPVTGNLWVEPQDYQVAVTNHQTPTTTPYSVPGPAASVVPAPTAFTVPNPDSCRSLIVTGNAVASLSFTAISANGNDNVSVYAGLYTGTVPSPPQLRAQYSNPASTAAWTTNVAMPFSAVVAPGATLTITPALWISANVIATFNNYVFEFEGLAVTQRTAL